MKIMNKNIKAFEKIEKPIVKFSEGYCKNIDFRTALKVIPVIGDPLDTLFAYKGSKIMQERSDKFIAEVTKELEEIEKNKVDESFLESDDFFYLFQKLYKEVLLCEEKEKTLFFKNILVNSIKIEYAEQYYKQRFVNIIASLSTLHIYILQYYYDREDVFKKESRQGNAKITSLEGIVQKFSDQLSKEQIESFCADLLSRGFLFDALIGKYGYKQGYFRITKSGIDLLRFIK